MTAFKRYRFPITGNSGKLKVVINGEAAMWYREYRDYKPDEPLRKQTLKSGQGIVGCEMHEIFGWGNHLHHPCQPKKSFLSNLFLWFRKGKKRDDK